MAVLWVAVAYGVWPSLWAALLGMLCFNFFFLPPLYTFTIAAPENIVALSFFFITAVFASHLGARIRDQAVVARHRADITQMMYQFSRQLAGIVSLDDLLWAACHQIAMSLDMSACMMLPEGGKLAIRASYALDTEVGPEDLAAATWAWKQNRPAGRGSDTLPGVQWLFSPLATTGGTVAVIGLHTARSGPLLDPEQQSLLDALSDQTALAIERITLAEDLDKARLHAETEKLRGAVLSSISHDLRTPLAAILGAASSLDSYGHALSDADRHELLATIRDEAERLNRFVANLLDMTRLEAGAVSPRRERVDLAEVASSAVARAARILAAHEVRLDVEPGLPMPYADAVLLEQALFNILDNAGKYTSTGTAVTLHIECDGTGVVIRVRDEGEGLPVENPDRAFQKFARFRVADRSRPGTGLGLAIARGFVEAMGGQLVAANRRDRSGAEFTLSFPLDHER
jgi:two-component system sensor histidine kinase KdpD